MILKISQRTVPRVTQNMQQRENAFITEGCSHWLWNEAAFL